MKLTAEDVDMLRVLEECLWRTESRFDPHLMGQTFAEEFFEFGRSGRHYGRSEMLLEPCPDTMIDATLPLPDYAMAQIAPDVVLATYTSEVRNDGFLQKSRRSSIWVRTEGRWKLRFHQGTPC